MARRKRAPALFDVIAPRDKASPRALGKPSNWLVARLTGTGAASASVSQLSAPPPSAPRMPATKASSKSLDVKIDRDRQLVKFRLNYTTAITIGFAVLTVVFLAYLLGKSRTNNTHPETSPSTPELVSGPPSPHVLDVGRSSSQNPAPRTETRPTPPVNAQSSLDRVVGRQYVVIQSYRDLETANAAKDFLSRNSVPCTVEKGLKEWADSSWYVVVGLQGFDRTGSNPEFENHITNLRKLGTQFARDSKYKEFQPTSYRWRG